LDWDWSDAAIGAWTRAAGHEVDVVSLEVEHPGEEAAIVQIADRRDVLTVQEASGRRSRSQRHCDRLTRVFSRQPLLEAGKDVSDV
jgi:hypothetical protein